MIGVFRLLGSNSVGGKEQKKSEPVLSKAPAPKTAPSSSIPKSMQRKVRQLVKAASLEAEAGDWHKAEEAYTAAIALKPCDEELFRLRSEVLCKLGKAEEALWDANQALGLSPTSLEGMCCQAAALALQGRNEEAAAVLSAAVRLHPHHIMPRQRLLELRGLRSYAPSELAISSAKFPCTLRPCVAAGVACTSKRLSKVSELDLLEAAEILSRAQHPHVVRIVGYCLEYRALIFENVHENAAMAPALGWAARLEAAAAICSAVLYLQRQQHTPMKFRILAPEDVVVSSQGIRKVIPTYVTRAYCRDLYHKDSFCTVLLTLLGAGTGKELLMELEQDYGREFVVSSLGNELETGAQGGPCWPKAVAERAVRAALLCLNKTWHVVEESCTEQALKELQLLAEKSQDEQWLKNLEIEAEEELLSPSMQSNNLADGGRVLAKSLTLDFQAGSCAKGHRSRRRTTVTSAEDLEAVYCVRFTMEEMVQATQGFARSSRLGQGEHGEVFLGTINHMQVVVKRLFQCRKDLEGFEDELTALTRFRHPNLLPLLGYCPEGRCLVYEYIQGGSLQDRLSGAAAQEFPLTWAQRVRAAAELTKALLYLHGSYPPIAHRDIKLSNLFLTETGQCKVSDFGVARLIPKVRAPRGDKEGRRGKQVFGRIEEEAQEQEEEERRGYMDPEALLTGRLTRSSDVYALGLVILQLLTGFGDVKQVHSLLRQGSNLSRSESISLDSPSSSASSKSAMNANCAHPPAEPSSSVEMGWEKKAALVLRRLDGTAGAWPREVVQDLTRVAVRCAARDPALRPKLGKEVRPLLDTALKLAAKHAPVDKNEDPPTPSSKVQQAMDHLLNLQIPPELQIKLVKLLYNNPQRAEMFLALAQHDTANWLDDFMDNDSA